MFQTVLEPRSRKFCICDDEALNSAEIKLNLMAKKAFHFVDLRRDR
jgi:hypothetical protein